MISAEIIWNVAPDFLVFSDSYAIRWYGILFSLGYIVAYAFLLQSFKKEQIPQIILEKMTLAAIVGGVVGARLGHCFFYEPMRYFHNPIEMLYIWQGGLASHGGALGVLIAFWILIRKTEYSFSFLLSRAMLVVPLTGAFIRVGNLMNSEIYGVETSLPWGFVYTQSADVLAGIEEAVPRHPTQLYEAAAYFLVFIVLQFLYWKSVRANKPIAPNKIIGIFLIGIFASRFVIEFFKVYQVSYESSWIFNLGQLLSVPFILFGLFALLYGDSLNSKHANLPKFPES